MSTSPYVATEIEIPFPPDVVAKVFFDFEHFSEIKGSLVKDIKRRPDAVGPLAKGEILDVNFSFWSAVTITEITPTSLFWRGDAFYVMSGLHGFSFEPSKITPGHTTFLNTEAPLRANIVLMRLLPVTKMFSDFNVAFKARVVAVNEK